MKKSTAQIIEQGEIEVLGRLVDASNATLLANVKTSEATPIKVVYKPIAGERPLWDFPHGTLAQREVAAFKISLWGGFNCVPFTILREGPFGPGAVQEWIESPEELNIIELTQSEDPRIRNLALFDVIVNNTDRKFGHILVNEFEQILGCDHGVTFHQDFKLRTVIWQFAAMELNEVEIRQLRNLQRDLTDKYQSEISELLHEDEVLALITRIEDLLNSKEFPLPSQEWPAVPWPPV